MSQSQLQHIIKIETTPAVGVTVKSVLYSKDVRRAVCIIARDVLLNISPADYEAESFKKIVTSLKQVFSYFNDDLSVPVSVIRNAIRVIDLSNRISEIRFDKSFWLEVEMEEEPPVPPINTEVHQSWRLKSAETEIFPVEINGGISALLNPTVHILIDSLIQITPDFE